MLVLSRKPGEEIIIPEINLRIKIIETRQNGTVRIGLEAPEALTILRAEVPPRLKKTA